MSNLNYSLLEALKELRGRKNSLNEDVVKRNYSYDELEDMIDFVYKNCDVFEYADDGWSFYDNIIDALENEYDTSFSDEETDDILEIVTELYESETGEPFDEDDDEDDDDDEDEDDDEDYDDDEEYDESLNENFPLKVDIFTEDDINSILNLIKGSMIKFTGGFDTYSQKELSDTGIVDTIVKSPKGSWIVELKPMNKNVNKLKVNLLGLLKGETSAYKGFNAEVPVKISSVRGKYDKLQEIFKKSNTKEEFDTNLRDLLLIKYTGNDKENMYNENLVKWINDHVLRIQLKIGENSNNGRKEKMLDQLYSDFPNLDEDTVYEYNNDLAHVVAMVLQFSKKDLPEMPEVLKKHLDEEARLNDTNYIWQLLRDYGYSSEYPNLYFGYGVKEDKANH